MGMNIQQQTQQSIKRFRERVLPIEWTPRGILTSEGFAVCAMADLHKVDVLIESGVCNARSTVMWARYMPDAEIVAVDWKLTGNARERLEPYDVTLIEGDATSILPADIDLREGQRIGVFIDGPKGAVSVNLARRCMEYPQVAFVGVHDMTKLLHGKPHAERAMLESAGWSQWFTDEEWFVNAYGELDKDDSHLDIEQGTQWTPGFRNELGQPPIPTGSYGYTIGFLHKDAKP